MEYPKFPHTAIISGVTGCGKTKFIMDLLISGEVFFDAVIVVCPTFLDNSSYDKKYFNNNTGFYFFTLKRPLSDINYRFSHKPNPTISDTIDALMKQFKGCGNVLIVLDDVAAEMESSRRNTSISRLAISGRHQNFSLWILTQKYTMIAKEVREQAQWVCSFYTKDKKSFREMIEQNNVGYDIDVDIIYKKLADGKYSKLLLKFFHPRKYYIN